MAQEVRDYVEAVLNSLSANVPKVSPVDTSIGAVIYTINHDFFLIV